MPTTRATLLERVRDSRDAAAWEEFFALYAPLLEGYARALEDFDARLPEILDAMRADDLFIITADHGNDPTKEGSDHTREYAPLLVYGKNAKQGVDLGTRESLADIGQTIAENFGLELKDGASFLSEIV